MNKCMRCGHELIISGNSMLSDYMDTQTEEDDAIVTYMFCPVCGEQHNRDVNAAVNIKNIAFDKQNLVGIK